jgi:hypothetical protein
MKLNLETSRHGTSLILSALLGTQSWAEESTIKGPRQNSKVRHCSGKILPFDHHLLLKLSVSDLHPAFVLGTNKDRQMQTQTFRGLKSSTGKEHIYTPHYQLDISTSERCGRVPNWPQCSQSGPHIFSDRKEQVGDLSPMKFIGQKNLCHTHPYNQQPPISRTNDGQRLEGGYQSSSHI